MRIVKIIFDRSQFFFSHEIFAWILSLVLMDIRCCRIILLSEGLETVEAIIEAILVKATHAALFVFSILLVVVSVNSDHVASIGRLVINLRGSWELQVVDLGTALLHLVKLGLLLLQHTHHQLHLLLDICKGVCHVGLHVLLSLVDLLCEL